MNTANWLLTVSEICHCHARLAGKDVSVARTDAGRGSLFLQRIGHAALSIMSGRI